MAARTPEPTHQWMHNEETGGNWECPAGLVEAYVERGWEPCDGPTVTDQHLYDDPEDPRIQVVNTAAEAPVEEPVDPDLPHVFSASEDDEYSCSICNELVDDEIHTDDPGDPGESTTTTTEEH